MNEKGAERWRKRSEDKKGSAGAKCPKCGSDDFYLGDYSEHLAYDDVIDCINATEKKYEGFSVPAKCNDCGCDFTINFQMTGTEILEQEPMEVEA